MLMPRADIDDDALNEAVGRSGAATEDEVVNLALRAYIESRRRDDAWLRQRAEEAASRGRAAV